MTTAHPETEDLIQFDDLEEFDIPCDGPRVWPERLGGFEHQPAAWIGLKQCGHSRLLCDACKEFYLNRQAQATAFVCAECGGVRYESQFLGFERLSKS